MSNALAESLVYDAASGNYRLTYECDDEGAFSTTIEPHNKLAPAIESAFSVVSGGITYSYSITLGAASRQPLRMISLDPIQQVWDIAEPASPAKLQVPDDLRRYKESVLATAPPGWRVIHFMNRDGTARVGWGKAERPPSSFVGGSKQAGFTFSSRHLPGMFVAQFRADGAGWDLPCEGPDPGPVADALDVLRRNDHVPRFVAAPIIRVPHPFDAISVLTSLRSHVSQLEQWGLTDAAFAGQIRQHLSDAISKIEAGDSGGGATALGKLRVALRAKHPSLDSETLAHAIPPNTILKNPVDDIRKLVTDYDRVLTARVLDFDAAHVIGLLGPVAPGAPASIDCNLPPEDTICAPVSDPDGTFVVRWGEKSCPKEATDQSCEIRIAKYKLERSTDSKFIRVDTSYEGPAREFHVGGLSAGVYYFRVTADYSYCVKGYGFGYTSDYCDENSGHWQAARDTYSKGPNKTTVD